MHTFTQVHPSEGYINGYKVPLIVSYVNLLEEHALPINKGCFLCDQRRLLCLLPIEDNKVCMYMITQLGRHN